MTEGVVTAGFQTPWASAPTTLTTNATSAGATVITYLSLVRLMMGASGE